MSTMVCTIKSGREPILIKLIFTNKKVTCRVEGFKAVFFFSLLGIIIFKFQKSRDFSRILKYFYRRNKREDGHIYTFTSSIDSLCFQSGKINPISHLVGVNRRISNDPKLAISYSVDVAKSPILNFFGKRVREERFKKELSQEKLAELASLHRTYIGMIERGEKNITLENVEKISKALKISVSKLLEGA